MKNSYNKSYVLYCAANYPQKHCAFYNTKVRKTDYLIFLKGSFLDETQEYDLIFSATKASKADLAKWDVLDTINFSAPLVNNRTLSLLKEISPDDFQYFSAVIEAKDSLIEGTYWALNLLSLVDCVDLKHSLYEQREGGGICHIDRLVFKADCMNGHHLARVERYLPMIVASPELVKILKKNKIKGISFYKDFEAYDRYVLPGDLLLGWYEIDKDEGKRRFVHILNSNKEYSRFKAGLAKVPREILEDVVGRTLAKSDFHREQCEELLALKAAEKQS